MKYVEGYTSDEVKKCPFCGGDDIIHHSLKGEYECCECYKHFCVIEGEGE